MSVPVLIVGAGPTGLVLAIELARRGVPFRLIDRHPAPLGWDRATVVKARTLEIADMLGLADAFLDKGRVIERVDLFSRGDLVAAVRFEGLDTPFPHMLSLPESDTEAILAAELERLGGAIERGVELTALETTGSGVRACLRSGVDGDERIEIVDAAWVVGTDGLHSTVRHAVGDAFEGHDNPRLWGVIDGRLDGWKHPGTHIAAILQLPSANPIPLKDGRWRIYFRPEVRDASALDAVIAGLEAMSPGVRLHDCDAPRFFHTHSRVARKYRVGRVLVAGDAAHACSPIQGHGMNSGIQDAHNLGWKLALVVQGASAESLLDSYEAERRPAAELIVRSSDEAEATSLLQDPAEQRKMIAYLADPVNNLKAAIGESEIAHGYLDSPLVAEGGGYRVGDAPVEGSAAGTRLYELLRDGLHHLFVFGGDAARAHDLGRAHASRVAAHPVASGLDRAAPRDPEGALRARFGDADVALVRPDGYLACAGSGETGLAAAHDVLAKTFGGR